MLFFIYGSDTYRIKQRVDELVLKLNLNIVDRFSFDEYGDFERFEQAVKTVGLFADKQAWIVNEPYANDKLLDILKHYELIDDEDCTVIIKAIGTKAGFTKIPSVGGKELTAYLIGKKVSSQLIEPLDGIELNNWTVTLAKTLELGLDTNTAKALIDRITDNDKMKKNANNDRSFRIYNELLKIKNYMSKIRSRNINIKDLEILVSPIINHNIFAITDAVANKERGVATVLLHKQLSDGLDPYYVHTMLLYQFRNLLIIKSCMDERMNQSQIASKTKIHPYVVGKTMRQINKYEIDELKIRFTDLHQLELDTKNGISDIVDGLYQFIFTLK